MFQMLQYHSMTASSGLSEMSYMSQSASSYQGKIANVVLTYSLVSLMFLACAWKTVRTAMADRGIDQVGCKGSGATALRTRCRVLYVLQLMTSLLRL